MDAVRRAESPVQVINTRAHHVFEYERGLLPPPRPLPSFGLGTQFSLGRGRWTAEDVSIFSVADGKRMASTPPKAISNYENIRMTKIQRAALETPTMAGYRLLPEFTPGRAMLWGTVIAMWATGAVVATAMKNLEIEGAADASGKIRAVVAPWAAALERKLAPLRSGMSVATAAGIEARDGTAQSEMVRQLKERLMA